MAKEPTLKNGFLGPQPKFQTFGLGVLSHTDPRIHLTDENELRILIGYSKTSPVKTTFSLIDANTGEERSENVFAETDTTESIIYYHITIPSTGYWKFQIFALPRSEESTSLVGVYNYLIHCSKCPKKACPRPKQYKDWKDGCLLREPKILHKDATGPTVGFRVVVPDAKKVTVVVDQIWNALMLSDGEWIGNVYLGDHYGKGASVTVNACYGDNEERYGTLLEYSI